MRVIFLGSPAFALPSLEALRAAGHDIGLVVTQPDRPAGRGQKATPPAVAAYAARHGLPLWQTASVRGPDADARLRAVGAEAMALAAFAAMIPKNVLELTPVGVLNVHPSLLPRWRGAAPIQSALLAGDPETGVSIIRLVQALDAGPILLQERVPIAPEDDYLSLEPALAALGGRLLVRALEERPEPWTQDEAGVTFSKKIERADALVDWTQSAQQIWHQVRAYRAWPQAFTFLDGRVLKVLKAWPLGGEPHQEPGAVWARVSDAEGRVRPRDGDPLAGITLESSKNATPVVKTGAGWLRLDEVQLEGRRAQSGEEFLRGYPRLVGSVLGHSVA